MRMSARVDFSVPGNTAMAPPPEQGCLRIGPSYAKVSLRGNDGEGARNDGRGLGLEEGFFFEWGGG